MNVHGYFHSQKCGTRRDFSLFPIVSHILHSTASLVESIREEVVSKFRLSEHRIEQTLGMDGCWADLYCLFLVVPLTGPELPHECLESSRCLARPLEVADTPFCSVFLISAPSYIGRQSSTDDLCLPDGLDWGKTVSAAAFLRLQ